MNKIRNWSIAITCFFVCFFIGFITCTFTNHPSLSTILNGVSSVFATIAFGLWISYCFQRTNDNRTYLQNESIKKAIRIREFAQLQCYISVMVRIFFMREDQLINSLKNKLTCSFRKDVIDINNLTLNYFVFDEIYNNIEKYFDGKEAQAFIKLNIDVLYMRDHLGTKWYDETPQNVPEAFAAFSDFNNECIRLSKIMENLNLDNKIEIFSKDEINIIKIFVNKINLGYFINFNPPYEIIELFKHINKISSFVNLDFIPAYKKDGFWENVKKWDESEEKYNNEISNWSQSNAKKASDFLKTNFKNKNTNSL